MSIRSSLLTAAALVAMCAAPAMAGQQDFTLHNKSGHEIKSLYVSPSSEDKWGSDILGQDTLANGEDLKIEFDRGESECKWDVKVEFDDGTSAEENDIDFCTVADVTVNS